MPERRSNGPPLSYGEALCHRKLSFSAERCRTAARPLVRRDKLSADAPSHPRRCRRAPQAHADAQWARGVLDRPPPTSEAAPRFHPSSPSYPEAESGERLRVAAVAVEGRA
eukprot:scaffold57196_cov27-Tisochrysis_lutea.AAC.2